MSDIGIVERINGLHVFGGMTLRFRSTINACSPLVETLCPVKCNPPEKFFPETDHI